MNYEKIIKSMCYTYRHDYGLLDDTTKQYIYDTMKQIFQNDILPILNDKDKTIALYKGHFLDLVKTINDIDD